MIRLVLIASLLAAVYGKLVPVRLSPAGGKIVGGEDAEIEDVPYQTGVIFKDIFLCGGSIVSETVVVSAAHCYIGGASNYKIHVGSKEIYSPEKNQGQVVGVSKIEVYPNHEIDSLDYDAAMFFLSSPLELGSTVQPVTLPDQEQEVTEGTLAVTSGWGRLKENGLPSKVLQKVTIPIVDQDVCKAAYEELDLPITKSMVCAGLFVEGGKDACQGDSGGPLVAEGVLVGITSWGFGCARPGFPGVWTRVPAISDWIKNQLSNSGT